MVIILLLYVGLVWLIFGKLKLVRWGWLSGTLTVLVGLLVLATFVGLLNSLAPVGRVAVFGKVVEVTPNVAGPVTDIPVGPNRLIKSGSVLFKIDPAPFDAQTRAVEAQLKLADLRLSQKTQLQGTGSGRAVEVEQYQSEVDQLRAQLDKTKYDLDQTTVRAPADGYVTDMNLEMGERVTPLKSVLSFILADETRIVGIFSQNGLGAIKPGAKVQLAFSNHPGHIYTSTIESILRGIGEGQISTSGTLTRIASVSMTAEYPVIVNWPKELEASKLPPGMSGTATVYAENAGPIGTLGWALLFVRSLALYL